MDRARFDALTREIPGSLSRRGALLAAVLLALGRADSGKSQRLRDGTPRRRNACQVRCGLERRLCKAGCRDKGVAARDCKKLCNVTRDGCFLRCEFRPARKRYATRDPNG